LDTRKNYEFYTARDFAQDENFQEWILRPNLKNTAFWEAWIQEHPTSKAAITEAVSLVRSISFRSYKLTDSEKDKIWDGIWDKMNVEEDNATASPVISVRRASWRHIWKYAAVVLIGIAVFSVWQTIRNDSKKEISFNVEAGPGEVEKVVLPDSSEVTLNANSEVVYSENKRVREVWLKGEAYFHVKHTKDVKAFIVHTYNDVSVKVLGTRFNVNTFGKKISVVLEQGSIQLKISDSAKNETQLYLRPGEMLMYNKETGDYSKSKIDAKEINSWTSGKITMEDYSLEDAASFMQQVFDKKMVIKDSVLLANRISGSMPIVYNEDTMLVQFGKVFKVKFQKKDNEIWVLK
jgi:ferric-dicitrate binding protein FerR (iron transport regulator)